jgi:hypothetical protein
LATNEKTFARQECKGGRLCTPAVSPSRAKVLAFADRGAKVFPFIMKDLAQPLHLCT